ncbi:MAG: hypothetical protein IT370_08680 [Deltaproteobacteria bacterium]|nr:hypothetical protein [Deltaproteobacteria bacterium]
MSSRALSSLVIVSMSVALVACAGAPANRASGRVLGRPFSGRVTAAEYCEHCAGGELVTVRLGDPRGDTLEVQFEDCRPGRFAVGSGDGAEVQVRHEELGVDAVRGELRVASCSSKRLQASFWAEFPGGGRVSGRVVTGLKFDAGYD